MQVPLQGELRLITAGSIIYSISGLEYRGPRKALVIMLEVKAAGYIA